MLSSRDLRYLSEIYADKPDVKRFQDVLDQHPQVTMYQVVKGSEVTPIDLAGPLHPTSAISGDLVIVGAELSSLCTAIEAAEKGMHVVVVYAGPLGGLSADTGGNLRYFDIMQPSSHPIGQAKLWHEAMGSKAWMSIAPDTDSRIRSYLTTHYANRIELIKTKSYDGLWVEMSGHAIKQVDTPEGVAATAPVFIDGDPESRVAEKSGVPYTTDTPHMSCGMTFDVSPIDEDTLDRLADDKRVSPEAIERMAGVTAAQVAADPLASAVLKKLQVNIATDFVIRGPDHAYGFCGLAAGYGFYAACVAIRSPSDDLTWLNQRRYVSGFNIARFGTKCAFNSISYRFMKNWLQHSHSLDIDPTFAPIRNTEMPLLTTYLRAISELPSLEVRMPPQFYIRSSTAFFTLLHPYTASEFNGPKTGPYYTHYPMDLRDLFFREKDNFATVTKYVKAAKGKNFWTARASAAETTVPNLYLVNKCGVTPTYSGGLRTEQSAINLGAAVVDALATKQLP